MRLVVYPAGRVQLSIPQHIPPQEAHRFLQEKIRWIEKHYQKAVKVKPPSTPNYLTGEKHPFLGELISLQIIEQKQHYGSRFDGDKQLFLYLPPQSLSEERAHLLNEWYRFQLKKLLPPIIAKWEQIVGVKINDWRIRRMRTRWGTCNIPEKRIWLSLELAKKPISCIEYVVVHELTHLLERNHTPRFHCLMSQFLPNWKEEKERLNLPSQPV